MENTSTICPVCTLYLREGINLETHLHTHPKEQVIEALLKFSNGGTVAAPVQQSSSTSTSSTTLSSTESISSGNSQTTVQTVANQNSPFLSGPYMAPQAQMTTAVTYQHFITSNGSTFMPQYIQVPTVVNSSSNIPVISNQTVNYIPNQPVNYSPTMYNPLYNPYIPQPYPFTQPVYTSMTMSTLPSGDSTVPSSVSTENSSGSDEITNQVVATTQSNVLTKNTVVVNTSSEIRSTSTGSKKSLVKYRKKVKKRIFRTKLGEPSSSMSVIKSPVKNGSKPLGMKRSVISTIRPKISLQASNVTTNLTIIPPAPLKLITKPTTNTNLNAATPPPPPPLSKAPCIGPSSVTIIKSENLRECGRPQSTPAIILSSDNNNSVNHLNRPQKINSVIVESNSFAGNSANETETFKHVEKSNQVEVSLVETSSASVIMRKDKERSESLRIESGDDITITKVNTPAEHYKEGPEEEQAEDEDEMGGINDEIGDLEQDNGNPEKTAKFFEMIEVVEESKAHIIDNNLSSEPSKNSESDVSDNSFSATDFRVHEESVTSKGNAQKEKESESKTFSEPEVQAAEAIDIVENIEKETSQIYNYRDNKETRVATQAGNRFEGEVVIEATIQKQTELQSITYTDLQPAGSPRVLNDISLTPTINLSSYMEVEGIKIFFNNSLAAGASADPLGSTFKNLQSNTNDLPGFFKSESSLNNQAVVDSVIQLVSGNGSESKSSFNFGENYSATTSHIQEPQLDLPDLSPLPLNIQADESMPARGELSEQESLGAENTTWNLFHGADASNTKNLEDWRNLVSGQQSVNGNKSTGKTFKCSICSKVFSCPKERRVHKNTAHFEKPHKVSAPRKPRTYSCNFCSTVFTTFRERKIHVLQMHMEGKKHSQNLKMSEIKQENGELAELAEANKPRTTIKEEGEQENVKTETPTPAADSGSGTGVIPEAEAHRIKYCSQCSLPFVGVKKLREHLRIVHGKIRFKCETCSQTFDDDSEYNEHLLVHPLVCDKCGKTFHKKPNLNLHMKRHLEVKPYECSLCPKSFVTRQKLEEHMNGHSGKKPLKCPHCDKTFSRHSNLIQHRNLHHMNVKKKIKDFVCRCGEVFHSLRKLEWHKEVHDPKPKPCPFCSQKFIHSASVTRHIRRAHLPDYLPGDNREFDNVQCPVCEKTYLRSSLVVHMRVHNGEKPFACKICNKKFSTKWNLEIHNWTHQSRSNMPFKCHICKGAFFREPDFVAHLNAHRNYKPFTCNVCGQKFIRKYSCLRHQEEHKKNKQFVCGVSGCAKSFHRGYYLRDHMKVHTGVRPHTCHICGKASSTKSNHNKHVRIHDTREPINTEN